MGDQGNDGEDFLLERLHEATSGDAAVRQLRRRYDSLRNDYENLLDRLAELEERLSTPEPPRQPSPPSVSEGIAEALAAPLLRLRDDYLAAARGIQGVVSGLEGLASGFKGQHTVPPRPAPQPEPRAAPPEAPAEPPPAVAEPVPRVHKMQVDVKGSGFGELLDFQERLSQLPGVARVSINAIDNERATLVVELDPLGH